MKKKNLQLSILPHENISHRVIHNWTMRMVTDCTTQPARNVISLHRIYRLTWMSACLLYLPACLSSTDKKQLHHAKQLQKKTNGVLRPGMRFCQVAPWMWCLGSVHHNCRTEILHRNWRWRTRGWSGSWESTECDRSGYGFCRLKNVSGNNTGTRTNKFNFNSLNQFHTRNHPI